MAIGAGRKKSTAQRAPDDVSAIGSCDTVGLPRAAKSPPNLRDPFERLRIGDMSLEDFVANEDARVLHHTDNVMARMLAASRDRRRVAGWDHALLAQAALLLGGVPPASCAFEYLFRANNPNCFSASEP